MYSPIRPAIAALPTSRSKANISPRAHSRSLCSRMAKNQDLSIRSRLVGSWELVSYVAYSAENPKEFISPMGDDLKGIIMYTSDGYMSAHIQIPGQAHFKANDLNGGTKDELAEAARRHFGYTGPFYLDESGPEPILKHHMSISSFPNWLGNTQRRVMRFQGDELVLGPEAPIEIMGELRNSVLTWRRMPDNSGK